MSTTGENRLNLYRSSIREMPRVLRDVEGPGDVADGFPFFNELAGEDALVRS